MFGVAALDGTQENTGRLQRLASDWLRDHQPVVVYVKGRQGVSQDNARHLFRSVGRGGYCFPVCSCLVQPRVNCKGLVPTNAPGLGKQFTECVAKETGVKDQSWHNWISHSIIKRISAVSPTCHIKHHQRHLHHQDLAEEETCKQPLQGACARTQGLLPTLSDPLVGSVAIPQGPPGVEHPVPGGKRQVRHARVQAPAEEHTQFAQLTVAVPGAACACDQADPKVRGFAGVHPTDGLPDRVCATLGGHGDLVMSTDSLALDPAAVASKSLVVVDLQSGSSVDHLGTAHSNSKGDKVSDARLERGNAPQQKVVVFVDELHPAEQAIKHKEKRKAREEKLAEEGFSAEGIKSP